MSSSKHNQHKEWQEQLAVKAAHCYYNLGMTQQEVAALLGIGRARVIRILSEARERGVVSIKINSPLIENIKLAEELSQRFNLKTAEVCMSHANGEAQLADQLALSASDCVLQFIENHITIGIGWGITLRALATRMDQTATSGVSVVPLLGSLTQQSSIDRFEATTLLASRLNAECFYLPAPIVCDSKRSKELIIGQMLFRQVYDRALAADLALVSIGGLNGATIREAGLVDAAEYASVRDHGAVGNFLGLYIDANAKAIAHPINQRIVGVAGKVFKQIPRRVMISAGKSKVDAMAAVLNQGLLTDVITDNATAKALLEKG